MLPLDNVACPGSNRGGVTNSRTMTEVTGPQQVGKILVSRERCDETVAKCLLTDPKTLKNVLADLLESKLDAMLQLISSTQTQIQDETLG